IVDVERVPAEQRRQENRSADGQRQRQRRRQADPWLNGRPCRSEQRPRAEDDRRQDEDNEQGHGRFRRASQASSRGESITARSRGGYSEKLHKASARRPYIKKCQWSVMEVAL